LKLSLPVGPEFNFWRTVCSHGWCALPPFKPDREARALKRSFELSDGRVLAVTITHDPGWLRLDLPSVRTLGDRAKGELLSQVKSCLRLEEDYREFYTFAKSREEYRWIPRAGAGRMLRAPTVFEDVVKMICTTNCSWALTKIMVGNLCRELGRPGGEGSFTFPRPEAVAGSTERFLRKHVRAGYRAPYLLEASRRAASGELDFESWRGTDLPASDLYDQVRSVKGIGPYAAGNILKLLGHYDHLGIDSWCRKKFFEIHRNGRKTSDRVIERHYESLGKWRGLFFWMDLTKHWYEKEFPF
jgi:3-methyladenine DNA glycosylase/8-oxoguanine DNA glycosylase